MLIAKLSGLSCARVRVVVVIMDQKSMDRKLSAVWITLSLGYVEMRLASGKGMAVRDKPADFNHVMS